MSDFGFVGSSYEAPSIYQDAQECINWRVEMDNQKPEGSRGATALYPTPGYTLLLTLPTSPVRCLKTITGAQTLLAVAGNALYTISATNVVTNVGTLLTSTGPVYIDDNGVQAMIVDGANRYAYGLATNIFAVIPGSDGAFTGGVQVYTIDNYFVYNRPLSAQWACSTALSTATPALSFASSFGSPGNIVAMITIAREVFLLGEKTTEVWIDTGGFPFPFSIIPGSNTQTGCAAPYSVAKIGASFCFVSQNSRGEGMVMMNQGYDFVRISTHAVENSLIGKVISDAIGYTYQIGGHEVYVLTFPSADITWCFDMVSEQWHKWLSVDNFGQYHRHFGNCYAMFQHQSLIGDYKTGNVYSLSNTVYTENGNTIRRLRRCPHLVSDFNRQFFNELQLQFQPGVGLSTGQGSDPQAMLRWSNDGGSTWSSEHWKPIGKQGKYKNRVIWRRLGQARDRVYEVVVTDPIKAVIVSANLRAEAGDN